MLAVSLDGHQTTQTTRLSNSDYELTYAKLIKELESKINTLPSILKKIILDSHILFDPTREVKVPLFALFGKYESEFTESDRKNKLVLDSSVRVL